MPAVSTDPAAARYLRNLQDEIDTAQLTLGLLATRVTFRIGRLIGVSVS